jgi:hypothetical protein
MICRARLLAVAPCAALLWAGCASPRGAAQPELSELSEPSAATSTDAVAGEVSDYTMDDHIDWLLGVLDRGRFDDADATQRFDPSFLAQFPVAALNAPLGQIARPESAPWQVLDDHREDRVAEITVESAAGARLAITLALASASPHRIEGLNLRPTGSELAAGYTFAQLDSDLRTFARDAALGVYDVTNGECVEVHELDGDRPLAVGSAFKLWVLAELAQQVDDGTATWDEPLAVQAELRSNPAGRVFQLVDGDTLSLQEYAEAMISISDNTATDHLIARLGRESVESAIVRAGVAQPALDQPLLATRELFWLKYLADAPNPRDWNDADTEGRRAILADLEGKVVPWVLDPTIVTAPNADGLPQDRPRHLEIEYFASPQDLCSTLIHLDDLASRPGLEPVAAILSINPGAQLDPDTWTEVRFKGGSEPGVFALTWWLRRNDGRRYMVAGILNDPDASFDQLAASDLIDNAIDLLEP